MMEALELISKINFCSQAFWTTTEQWIDRSMEDKTTLKMSFLPFYLLFLSLWSSIFSHFFMRFLICESTRPLQEEGCRRKAGVPRYAFYTPDAQRCLLVFSWREQKRQCNLCLWVITERTDGLRRLEPEWTLGQQRIILCSIKPQIFERFIVITDLPISLD